MLARRVYIHYLPNLNSGSTAGSAHQRGLAPGRYSGFALMRSVLGLALVVGAILGFWAAVTNEQLELPGIAAQERVETFATSSRHDAVVSDLEEPSASAGRRGVRRESRLPSGVLSMALEVALKAGWKMVIKASGTADIVVRPLSELPHGDYRQIFELAGSANFLNSFRNYLDEQGISHRTLVGRTMAIPTVWDCTWKYLSTVDWLLFCFVRYRCHRQCSHDAVRQLHGIGLLESAWCELRRAGQRTVVPIGVVSLAVLAATAWWARTPTPHCSGCGFKRYSPGWRWQYVHSQ